jgi:hypothetical protein
MHMYMHRQLLGLAYGDVLQGDHIDRDHLNNQKVNLRVVTTGQNSQNVRARRGARGIGWCEDKQKWRARCKIAGRTLHIGYFLTEEEADAAAREFRRQHLPYSVD